MGICIWISGNGKEKLVNSQWWVEMGGCSEDKSEEWHARLLAEISDAWVQCLASGQRLQLTEKCQHLNIIACPGAYYCTNKNAFQ